MLHLAVLSARPPDKLCKLHSTMHNCECYASCLTELDAVPALANHLDYGVLCCDGASVDAKCMSGDVERVGRHTIHVGVRDISSGGTDNQQVGGDDKHVILDTPNLGTTPDTRVNDTPAPARYDFLPSPVLLVRVSNPTATLVAA